MQGVAHITVGRMVVPMPSKKDRDLPWERACASIGATYDAFHGLSSNYVFASGPGARINAFLDAAEGFHLQKDVAKPMIMVSAGIIDCGDAQALTTVSLLSGHLQVRVTRPCEPSCLSVRPCPSETL